MAKQVYTPFMMNAPAYPEPVYTLEWAKSIVDKIRKEKPVTLPLMKRAESVLNTHLLEARNKRDKERRRVPLHIVRHEIRELQREMFDAALRRNAVDIIRRKERRA